MSGAHEPSTRAPRRRRAWLLAIATLCTPGAAALADGARIYEQFCSVCHGENGEGAVWGRASLNPPPANFTRRHPQRDLPRERMLTSVTHGRPGTAMMAFGSRLSAADIDAVVDFIRATFMSRAQHGEADAAGKHDHGAHDHGAADAAQSGLGDVRNGARLYAENCVACHGEDGDGKGPRAYFIVPRPRNFTHPATLVEFDREHLIAAIKHGVAGREMPAWGKVLSDREIADIAEYVYTAFLDGVKGGHAP